VYVVNGSEASQASGVSRFSRRSSANYEPLPHNGIGRVRHTRLTEEELDRQSTAVSAAVASNGGQKRSPDWTGSRERKAASKIAKVRYLYQTRVTTVAESVSKVGKLFFSFLIPILVAAVTFLYIYFIFFSLMIYNHLHTVH
jgi:hypothetical protein